MRADDKYADELGGVADVFSQNVESFERLRTASNRFDGNF
jgi:hypothetical protein